MKNGAKLAIVALLALAVAATFVLRGGKRAEDAAGLAPTAAPAPATQATATPPSVPAPQPEAAASPAPVSPPTAAVPARKRKAPAPLAKPRVLELGSMRCMACLEMAKVLEALRASQGPKLRVDFIDVFEQPEAADRHKISLIPTQVLFDAAGGEIFRHTGYLSHDDILAKFRELGVKL